MKPYECLACLQQPDKNASSASSGPAGLGGVSAILHRAVQCDGIAPQSAGPQNWGTILNHVQLIGEMAPAEGAEITCRGVRAVPGAGWVAEPGQGLDQAKGRGLARSARGRSGQFGFRRTAGNNFEPEEF